MALVAGGRLRDCVMKELPFEQLPEALTRLKAGKARGKVLCVL